MGEGGNVRGEEWGEKGEKAGGGGEEWAKVGRGKEGENS